MFLCMISFNKKIIRNICTEVFLPKLGFPRKTCVCSLSIFLVITLVVVIISIFNLISMFLHTYSPMVRRSALVKVPPLQLCTKHT